MGLLFYINLIGFTDWEANALMIRRKMRDNLHSQKGQVENEDLKVGLLH